MSKPDLDHLGQAFMDSLSNSDQNFSVIHSEKYLSPADKLFVFYFQLYFMSYILKNEASLN